MRLRQIALVATDLEAQVTLLHDILGIEVGYRDPNVGVFGLKNILAPIGGEFLEIVSPVEENTAAGRYMARRGGDSGYMVILQTDDAARDRQRIADMGIRIIWNIDRPNHIAGQYHPHDVGGILLSIESQPGVTAIHAPMCDWPPAGPDWRDHVQTGRISAITGVDIAAADPPTMAQQWAEILQHDLIDPVTLALPNAKLRFRPGGDGILSVDVATQARTAILAAAAKADLPHTDDSVTLCGTVFNLR